MDVVNINELLDDSDREVLMNFVSDILHEKKYETVRHFTVSLLAVAYGGEENA